MCVIFDRPAYVPLDEELLQNGMIDNPDGWGIMLARKGQIVTYRGLTGAGFWDAWDRVRDHEHVTVHFRWATHGPVKEANCHPFAINGGEYAIAHNGVINVPITVPDRSDTWHYAHAHLGPTLDRLGKAWGRANLATLLASRIGSANKVVILRRDGSRMILNRDRGIEHDGVWLSNNGPLWTPTVRRSSLLDLDDYADVDLDVDLDTEERRMVRGLSADDRQWVADWIRSNR